VNTLRYKIWLSLCPKMNAKTAARLCAALGNAETVYFAREKDILAAGFGKDTVAALSDKSFRRADNALEACRRLGISIISRGDSAYPERLENIADPPLILYVRGTLPDIDAQPVAAVVGTRSCTPYGMRSAQNIGYGLARRGITVATGLARGVDTAAAIGALKGGGKVIGVAGGGVDIPYPKGTERMFEDVASSGAVISEYPPGTEPASHHFPQRNRILSGVSVCVAVIEAPLRSGALITANYALEQNRDVFAMPGNIDSKASAGANLLIKDGAFPLTGADDIARELKPRFADKITFTKALKPEGLSKIGQTEKHEIDKTRETVYSEVSDKKEIIAAKTAAGLSGDELTVFTAISPAEPSYLDDIITKSGLPASTVLSVLTLLEIDGHIKSLGAGYFDIAGQ